MPKRLIILFRFGMIRECVSQARYLTANCSEIAIYVIKHMFCFKCTLLSHAESEFNCCALDDWTWSNGTPVILLKEEKKRLKDMRKHWQLLSFFWRPKL